MSVQSDVVLPRDLMQSLASVHPRSHAELESALQEVPWRLSHFGDQILQALNGKK
jgi:ribonuclease D